MSHAATDATISAAVRTLEIEGEGIAALRAALGNGMGPLFAKAVAILAGAKGRVIVTGIGKSGHVGQKIAATFASTADLHQAVARTAERHIRENLDQWCIFRPFWSEPAGAAEVAPAAVAQVDA